MNMLGRGGAKYDRGYSEGHDVMLVLIGRTVLMNIRQIVNKLRPGKSCVHSTTKRLRRPIKDSLSRVYKNRRSVLHWNRSVFFILFLFLCFSATATGHIGRQIEARNRSFLSVYQSLCALLFGIPNL